MQNVGGKVEEFVLTNYILMQHSWKNFLVWYSARKSMANVYVWFKNKSLIGGSLMQTVFILPGNQTQVTFSGIIPLDHQDFCRYCQYSSSEQKSDCLYHIYAGAQPEIVQGRGGFLKLGHFNKHFLKKSRKKLQQQNILELFVPDTLKTIFWMVYLTSWWKKSGHFFIFKKGGEHPLLFCILNRLNLSK